MLFSCSKQDDTSPGQGQTLQEDFDAPSAIWREGDSGNGACFTRNGWLVISYNTGAMGTYHIWADAPLFPAPQSTRSLEIRMRHSAGHPDDTGTLLFSYANPSNYVAFSLGQDGYRVFQVVNGQTVNIVTWTSSPAIHSQLNEENTLQVKLAGDKLQYFINGRKVTEINAGEMMTLDRIGFQLYKASTTTTNTVYEVDYIRASM
ncbi:hypothetical protein [Chitinophaga japonensis]|nr:hypothetical protein [Chitinophaga japonensis]